MLGRPLCHISNNEVINIPKKRYKMLSTLSYNKAHQKYTLRDMADILKRNFDVTNMPIYEMIKEYGRYETEQKFLEVVRDFDIFFIYFGKPGLDFSFYKKLKLKNPKIIIVYFEGDADIVFPNYVRFLVKDFDFYVSNDSIAISDIVSKMGCKSLCTGNFTSIKSFFPIKNIKKIYDVSFYGGLKADRLEYLDYLKQKNVKVKCLGGSFEGGHLESKDLNKFLNQSKIILSFNKLGYNNGFGKLPKNYKPGLHIKGRIWESILCKSFVLSEKVEKFERFFIPNKELVSFKGRDDLVAKIKFYLKHDLSRERIAKNAYHRLLKDYEAGKQTQKMSNIIIKICNEKNGLKEKFQYLDSKFGITTVKDKGDLKSTKYKFYVNYCAGIIKQQIKKKEFKRAFLECTSFRYGIPFYFIKTEILMFVIRTLVNLRDTFKKVINFFSFCLPLL